MHHPDEYHAAMGHFSRLDLYDPLVRIAVRELRFKRRLLVHAAIQPGFRVLDLGCGTGTLALMAKRSQPGATIVALDGDAQALDLAHAKIAEAGVQIALHHAFAQQLPYPDAVFDRVLSTLLLHHLSPRGKAAALAEAGRVLRPGGELHVGDFGRPANWLMRAGFSLVQKFEGKEYTEENGSGRLPELMSNAGLRQVRETASFSTAFGTLRLYTALAPS